MAMAAEGLRLRATHRSDTTLLMGKPLALGSRLSQHQRLCNNPSLCRDSNIHLTLSPLQRHRPAHRRRHPNTIHMGTLHSEDSPSTPNISPRKWGPRSTTRLLTQLVTHETHTLPYKQLPTIRARRSSPNPTTPLLSIQKTSNKASRTSIPVDMRRHLNTRRRHPALLKEATRHSKATNNRQAPDQVHMATCQASRGRQRRAMRRRACRLRRASVRRRSSIKLISRSNKQGTRVAIRDSSIGDLAVYSFMRSWSGLVCIRLRPHGTETR